MADLKRLAKELRIPLVRESQIRVMDDVLRDANYERIQAATELDKLHEIKLVIEKWNTHVDAVFSDQDAVYAIEAILEEGKP